MMGSVSNDRRKKHQSLLALGHVRTKQEGGHLQARKKALTSRGIWQHLDLDFPASRTV